jgi:hypothetical protein
MYPVYFTIGLILTVAIVGAISERVKRSRAKKVSTEQTSTIRTDAIRFVNKLQELGYFKYSDPEDLDAIRQTMIDEFEPNFELVSAWDDDTGMPLDYRYYFCDNEDLFEAGGFTDMLEILRPTFDKIGFNLTINDHHEVWDSNKGLDHTITLNGTKYTIFKNFKEAGWGEAAQRLAEILNSELEKQNKDERVYLVSGGNDGRLIFLTEPQFNYIDSIYANKHWKPLRVEDWCRTMEVSYMSVD